MYTSACGYNVYLGYTMWGYCTFHRNRFKWLLEITNQICLKFKKDERQHIIIKSTVQISWVCKCSNING